MSWRVVQSHVGHRWRRRETPLAQPVNPVKFLTRESRIYSIGSCFAANINHWLRHHGFEVPPVEWGSHYNPRTILYEMRRAMGLPAPELDWQVTRDDGSVAYVDALRHCVDADSADALVALKARITARSSAALRAADSVLITLGLADVWELEAEGENVILNRAPYRQARMRRDLSARDVTSRFLSVEECRADIATIVRLIRTHKPVGTPVILTVSPVPLKHAGSRYHPQIANNLSKSTLIAAIFAFLAEDRGDPPVSYFPSFEFFQTNPDNLILWQADERHPTAEAVSAVAQAFLHAYSDLTVEMKPGFEIATFGDAACSSG